MQAELRCSSVKLKNALLAFWVVADIEVYLMGRGITLRDKGITYPFRDKSLLLVIATESRSDIGSYTPASRSDFAPIWAVSGRV